MAEIKGTNLAAPIVPFTDQDVYATHEAKYGKGGYRTVQNMTELRAIPTPRLEEGMLVYVMDDDTGIHTYQYLGGKWVRNRIGNGIPIYTQELIEDLGINPNEDEYISIPSLDTDLNGEVENKTYTTTENGTYVDVLFKAIRSLQSEVARLKNSFIYGIESYTGKVTTMSRIEGDYDDIDVEEEPLWAIDEDGLSQLGDDITLGPGGEADFDPSDNVTATVDEGDSYDSFLTFTNSALWTVKDSAGTGKSSQIYNCTDNKIFLYFTANATKIKLNLDGYVEDITKVDTDITPLELDLNKIQLSRASSRGFYNILVVISRNQKLTKTDSAGLPVYSWTSGQNFIWISIGDPHTDQTLAEGYWSGDKLFTSKTTLDKRYTLAGVVFTNLTLSKFNIYSKWQDFSREIAGSKPSEEDYKFKAAHITIRSVEKQADLVSVKDQIMNNELIWVEETNRLWIKTKNALTIIGGGNNDDIDDTGMTQEEMIAALEEMGIVQETNGDLKLSNLAVDDITFIHQASGRRFKFDIDESGELHSQEIGKDSDTFTSRIGTGSSARTLTKNVRGFIGQLNVVEKNLTATKDIKLDSDRLKIGSFYAPLSTDIVHGCSHSYVELENTSDRDYALEGCYLHLTRPDSAGNQKVYHLALTGVIPAGGTYLVRGAKHAEPDDPNVYLKITEYDQEWYNLDVPAEPKLLSFEVDMSLDYTGGHKGYGIALTYGNKFGTSDDPTSWTEPLSATYALYEASKSGETIGGIAITSSNRSKFPYKMNPYFIDGLYYKYMVTNDAGTGLWSSIAVDIISNSIYRNTFELDPAKQAFQAFTTADSSRARWANIANDIQVVDLTNEFITFPHSEDKYAISNYTPKASYQHRNVSTDKTKLDTEKPNMVTTAFGIDVYKTRTFNWISVGYFDEYVWIKPSTASTWSKRIQSYIPIVETKLVDKRPNNTTDEQGNVTAYNTILTLSVSNLGGVVGDLNEYSLLLDADHNSVGSITINTASNASYTVQISGQATNLGINDTFYLVQPDDDVNSNEYPKKKFFSGDITNNIYARLTGRFPGDNSFYCSHKVVADIVASAVGSPTEYTYIVGRADKNGNPDLEHCSDPMKFTLYPQSYTPRVYQVTDQQGFHWIEYQVWAAVANSLNDKIASDQSRAQIIPILVNTGDMTQNGTRINEWFDYYQAGRSLFDHLEQMNVVGNNDLCGTNPFVLGTGDDEGKSNSFYFHLFYCYEVNPTLFTPLLRNLSGATKAPKYIPSLYYFDTTTDRFLAVNSELTEENCKSWFNLVWNGKTVNAYTGFTIDSDRLYCTDGKFTSIYTMLWRTLNDAKTNNKDTLVLCHEMPYTVITNESLLKTAAQYSRSMSNAGALVGSHTNQISPNEADTSENPKTAGLYWFSRLLEYFKIRLVIGGHKHTYACTYPVRENYNYMKNGASTSSSGGPMDMPETLQDDYVNFYSIGSGQNSTKFPYVKRESIGERTDEGFYPATVMNTLSGGVVYFMCQASGYKLTSNKELPSQNQKYSRILPKTTTTYSNGAYSDKASDEQKYPMFSIIELSRSSNSTKYRIRLARVTNIMKKFKFTQKNYETKAIKIQWLKENSTDNFGTWQDTEDYLFSDQI